MQGRAIWTEGPIHSFDLPSSSLERGGQALKSGASKTHAYMDEEVGTSTAEAWTWIVPSLSFIQGFMAGQAVLLMLFLGLFRYLFMTSSPGTRAQQQADLLQRVHAVRTSMDMRSHVPPYARVPYEQGVQACVQDLLSQVRYDPSEHAPESLDWLNVLVAQLLMSYRMSILNAGMCAGRNEDMDEPALPSTANAEKTAAKLALERVLNEAMQGRATKHFLDRLVVTDIDMGCRYPTFSHARVRPALHAKSTLVEIDFEYMDALTLGIDTRMWLHFPQWRFGSLAANLCMRVERFAGTLVLEIGTLPEPTPVQARVCLHPNFVLDAHLSTILGSKSKLQDVPKIEELFLARLRSWLEHNVVWPHFWHIPLPGIGTSPADPLA